MMDGARPSVSVGRQLVLAAVGVAMAVVSAVVGGTHHEPKLWLVNSPAPHVSATPAK
jgi:hypothetical protein